jgi:hypothetical protein
VSDKTGFDPTGCQSEIGIKQHGMLLNEKDIQRRYKRGKAQVLCATCDRWGWGNERCSNFFSPAEK